MASEQMFAASAHNDISVIKYLLYVTRYSLPFSITGTETVGQGNFALSVLVGKAGPTSTAVLKK